ncbi:MAG: polyisoprenyl-phosphate glycosyltransferase [Mucilaginibacter sp.]|nr:polyisoprenyl-phosphate glycosyltransferase [Mucilaginibacter sp.]
MLKKISIIIPTYNEEKNIGFLVTELNKVIATLNYHVEMVFVDDGSTDNTLTEIKVKAEIYSYIFFIELSKNFGKDYALKAGINMATGDAIITMDADLQHPPALIAQLINLWEKGNDIVYTYRKDANPDSNFYSRFSSRLFYKVINSLSEIKLEDGISDFRLIDRKVANQLKQIDECEIFLRGIIKWVGFIQIGIPYTPSKRYKGVQSYSFLKLMKLAISGIMSFSVRPLYVTAGIGLLFSLLPLFYLPYILISYFAHYAISGWASLIATIVFLGGLQLFTLGIIGVYVGKIFIQSKKRPNYIIRSTNIFKLDSDFIRI